MKTVCLLLAFSFLQLLSASAASANADLRPAFSTYLLEPKDQLDRPTCSVNAMAVLLEFEHNKYASNHPLLLSREYLNWAANEATGIIDDGSFFSHVVRGLNKHGICREEQMPYLTSFNPNNTPSAQAVSDAAPRKNFFIAFVKMFNDHFGLSQSQVDEIKNLLDRGYPVAIGALYPANSVFDADYVLQMPNEGENLVGHSVVIVGYIDDSRYSGGGVFIIRNSWGPNWLDHGHAKVPYGYYKLHGNDALAMDVGSSQPDLPFIQKNHVAEFEEMNVSAGTSSHSVQDMSGFGANVWSNDKHLFIGNSEVGQYIEFDLNAQAKGNYHLNIFPTKAPDFGMFDFFVNGNKVLENFDAFSQLVQPSERVKLGTMNLLQGANKLRVVLKGKSSNSIGHHFGLDFLELLPVPVINPNAGRALQGVHLLLRH